MISLPFDQIVNKISTSANMSQSDVLVKIEKKMEQLSGLISKDGAAHIIANELGVKLFDQTFGMMKIGNILIGMRSVETVGKVMAVYDVREFVKGETSGKVGSCILADETGSIRVTCWHAQAENLKFVKVDDVVRVVGGYVRDNNGSKELHLNDKSRLIINPPNLTVTVASFSKQRKKIGELAEFQSNVELFATIVQVFDPRYYEVCPNCSKRIVAGEEGYKCEIHGLVTPQYAYVTNVVLDDGTSNIRCVFFKDQTESLTHKNTEELLQYKNNPGLFEEVKNILLGEQIIVLGRVTKNTVFDRIEFIVQKVETPNMSEELKRLDEELTT